MDSTLIQVTETKMDKTANKKGRPARFTTISEDRAAAMWAGIFFPWCE